MSVALTKLARSGTDSQTSIDDEKKSAAVSVSGISLDLADPREEKRFFFQRRSKYDPDAVATLVRLLSQVSSCADNDSQVYMMIQPLQRTTSLVPTGE
jgi:hypothetical protein